MNKKRRLLTNKSKGATAVEYAVIVSLIAVVIIGAVAVLGQKASAMFSTTASQMPS